MPAIGISISFWPAAAFLRLLRRLLRSLGLGRGAADALAQRVHQIDDVLALGPLLRRDRLAGALLVDQVDQRGLVVVLELVGLEAPAFWFTMCLARSSMSLVTLTSWISSKYSSSERTS